MVFPNLKHEIELWKRGFTVIGIDEVGRGAFAGPLCVGGVIFKPTNSKSQIANLLSYGINDSKKLSGVRRKLLSKIIQDECFSFHISTISVAEINRIGVGKATFSAMRDVVKHLREKLPNNKIHLLTDAFKLKYVKSVGLKNQTNIVYGDSISLSIAASSIIAKVYRDNLMEKLSNKHPEFAWHQNKGYGTLLHREALKQHGPSPLHRRDFIRKFV